MQFINQMIIWEKRREIEEEQRQYDHLRASNGHETLLLRNEETKPEPFKEIVHVNRCRYPFSYHPSHRSFEKKV
jgi:hypothetical protein